MNKDEIIKQLYEIAKTDFETIGSWLSAASSDPEVCIEMKQDIEKWFERNNSILNSDMINKIVYKKAIR